VDGLVRGLRIATENGLLGQVTLATVAAALAHQFNHVVRVAMLVSYALTCVFGPLEWRRAARTWLLALLGALAYQPMHPFPHDYLVHALALIWSIALALPVAWLVTTPRLAQPLRLLAIAFVLYEAMPAIPRFCRVVESFRAVRSLARREEPAVAPLGSLRFFHRGTPCADPYCWDDYRATLAYLRRSKAPGTPVANLLKRVPFPSLNGPTGRPSPFRAESGICWMWSTNFDLDADFADALEQTPEAIVVWSPSEAAEPRLALERVTTVVLRHYHREVRFGNFEVWRR
jgi:hypothetical protein